MASDECYAKWDGRGTVPNVYWRCLTATICPPSNGPPRTARKIRALTTTFPPHPLQCLIPNISFLFSHFSHLFRARLWDLVYLFTPTSIGARGFRHVIPRTFLDGLLYFQYPVGYTFLLAFVIICLLPYPYTVAGLLCRWSLAGAKGFWVAFSV